jgi:hypothetical protein
MNMACVHTDWGKRCYLFHCFWLLPNRFCFLIEIILTSFWASLSHMMFLSYLLKIQNCFSWLYNLLFASFIWSEISFFKNMGTFFSKLNFCTHCGYYWCYTIFQHSLWKFSCESMFVVTSEEFVFWALLLLIRTAVWMWRLSESFTVVLLCTFCLLTTIHFTVPYFLSCLLSSSVHTLTT